MSKTAIYWPGLASMAAFYLLILGVGVYAAKRTKAQSTDDLMLAGRQLPLWVACFTMTATWVGGGYLNGTAESVFGKGIVWTQAPWGYAIALILGGLVFAGVMRRLRFHTLLDPFERRYGRKVAAVLFVPALIGEIFWSAAILAALGTTFGTILGLDVYSSILISAAIAVGYTLLGGLWAVAFTDVVQLLCVIVGLGLAIPFAAKAVGGVGPALSKYEALKGTLSPIPPLTGPAAAVWGNKLYYWIDMALLLMLGGIPWQVYFQRVLSVPDGRSARRLSIAAGIGCMLMALPAVAIGMIGAVADWKTLGIAPPANASLILPYVLKNLCPPLVGTIGLGAIAAAVMSSVDSSILSASSMFAWNVYRPLINRKADTKQIARCIRWCILAVGLVATWLALRTKSVYSLWYLSADLVYVILFPQFCLALFDKKSNTVGALSGAAMGLFLRLGGGEAFLGISQFLPYPWVDPNLGSLFPFRTFAMMGCLVTAVIVSRLTGSLVPPRSLEKGDA